MNIIRYTIALLVAIGCVACSQKQARFTIKGTIAQAEGKMLYLQEVLGNEILSLDSLKLDKKGSYQFEQEAPKGPQFYRLLLDEQSIYFAADTALQIEINAAGKGFGTDYKIGAGPSYNQEIRKVWLAKLRADARLAYSQELLKQGKLSYEAYQDSVLTIAEDFKAPLRNDLIFKNPRSPAAYFALFQQSSGLLFFNILEKADAQAFGAVATAYELYYPESAHTAAVKQMALSAISFRRQIGRNKQLEQELLSQGESIARPDFSLIDQNGESRSLNEIAGTHARVLLVFTSFSADWSPAFSNQLRAVYKKQAGKDFEMLVVAADRDLYFWQNAVRTMPGIHVNDKEATALKLYNVQQLPTAFLINGDKLERIDRIEKLL